MKLNVTTQTNPRAAGIYDPLNPGQLLSTFLEDTP